MWKDRRPGRRLAAALSTVTMVAGLSTVAVAGGASAQPRQVAGHSVTAGKHRLRAPGLVHPRPAPPGAAGAGPLPHPRPPLAPEQPAPAVHYSAAMRADLAAESQARATGKPVAVPSLTTDRSEVLAQPNGQFEMVSNTLPVRVRVGGAWTAVSTTLRHDPDGRWSAPLISAPVSFSGGGAGPLVTISDPAASRPVSMWWPYPLPRPVVSGAVALYRNVLPGVDLHLQAISTGYREVLIVNNAAAAADPRVQALTFTIRGGSGVRLGNGLDGALEAVDSATGKALFVSGRPMMWDSAPVRPLAQAASAASAGNGAVFTVSFRRSLASQPGVSAATVTLMPFSSAVTAPDHIRFPLYIDPEFQDTTTQYYAEVSNFGGVWNSTTATTSVPGAVEVGDCAYPSCTYFWNGVTYYGYVARDYFKMDTHALESSTHNNTNPIVYKAFFYPDEVGNSDGCTAQPVAVWSSGSITSSTTWGGPQGSQVSTTNSAAGGSTTGCPANTVQLDVTSYVQGQENNAPASMTFELRAPDETNELQYKTFTDNATLTVYFNFPPSTPASLSVHDEVDCALPTRYTPDATPTLYATATDNNTPPLSLDYTFTVYNSANSAVAGTPATTGSFGSGTQAHWPDAVALGAGAYHFTAQATNHLQGNDNQYTQPRSSPVSTAYAFTDLPVAPGAAPAVSSFDYPLGYWGQPSGAPGIFTVGTNGDANIAGFAYAFDNQSVATPATSDCKYKLDGGLGTSVNSNGTGNSSGELQLVQGSTAQIMVPANLPAGRHTLYVLAFDYAHNPSPLAPYVFYVAPNYSGQQTTYIYGSSLVSQKSGANKSLVVSQPNCCGMTWPTSSQLWFEATAAGQTFTVPFTVPSGGFGTWQLGAEMTTSLNYGNVQVDLDQSTSDINLGGTARNPFDGYSATVSGSYLDLGTQTLASGPHTLTFTVTGQDANSSGYELGLVYFTLSPTSRYEADTLTLPGASAPSWTGTNTPATTQLGQQCLDQNWEDHCQLFFTNATVPNPPATPPGSFTLTFNAPVASDYALGVNLATSYDYGELEFELDPSSGDIILDNSGLPTQTDPSAKPIDTYSAAISSKYQFLGGVYLQPGPHQLKVSVVNTTSPTGNKYNAGINFVDVIPITGAADTSFTAAMNNQGIASDGGSTLSGNFDLTNSLTGGNVSLQALEAAGITPGTASGPGSTFSLNGAQFTMQPLRTGSSGNAVADNVIPDGQEIPLQAVYATGVALLVASTCGASPAATATISYATGQPSQPTIPSVPDWLTGAPQSQAVTQLGWYDAGATKNTTVMPQLFEVILPADPNRQLASITLPVMPVNLLTDTHSCVTSADTLHILAIGTRTVGAPGSVPVWTGAYGGPMTHGIAPSQSLTGETLRESVPLTADGGGSVRIHLSNAYSTAPVTFDAVTVAAQAAAGGTATVSAPASVSFGAAGSTSVTVPAGGDAYSNPVTTPSLAAGSGMLTVSMHIPSSVPVPVAPVDASAQGLTTYYASGDQTANQDGSAFPAGNSLAGPYYLSGVDVSDGTGTDGTVAVFGDQTATAAPAGTSANWVSYLPADLGTAVPGSVVNVSTSTVYAASAVDSNLNDLGYAAAEPGLRDVIVTLGANDVLAGTPESTITGDLQALVASLKGWFVENAPGRGVKVLITTIPPLGLGPRATDAREGVREDVNAWLVGNNTTADAVLNIAGAVTDPANPNQVNPAYLSGGVPTAAYYQAIASAVATGIAGPPPFQL